MLFRSPVGDEGDTHFGDFIEDKKAVSPANATAYAMLREQLDDSPDELENLVNFLCIRILGENGAGSLVKEVLGWMKKNLPADYEWPGNVRELEQCVFNVLVRGSYKPPEKETKKDDLLESIAAGNLTADEVLNKYCLLIYRRTKNYCETARILELDRRTVKSRIERQIPADA